MSSSSEMVRPFSYTVKTALFALSDSYICWGVTHDTVTLERQIICRGSNLPQGTVHSRRQLLPLLQQQQLRSSVGKPSGGQHRSPPPQAGPRSPPEEAGQMPREGTLPALPEGFWDPTLEKENVMWITDVEKWLMQIILDATPFKKYRNDFNRGKNEMHFFIRESSSADPVSVTDRLKKKTATRSRTAALEHYWPLLATMLSCTEPCVYVYVSTCIKKHPLNPSPPHTSTFICTLYVYAYACTMTWLC